MFNFSKTKDKQDNKAKKKSWLGRLQQGLSKTRQQITTGFDDFLYGRKLIDDNLLDKLEAQLLQADIGMTTTEQMLEVVRQSAERGELNSRQALEDLLRNHLLSIIQQAESPLCIDAHQPYVVLMVGVNGAGKTTTIAKMAHYYKQQSKKVILAAGDTFRAAAVEQLQVWGERNGISVIAQHDGADSAAVVFDALQAAQARQCDLLLADTAGRLHTQQNLMDELAKIKRVMGKLDAEAPHEIMLVLDASMGQNALQQAKQFHEQIGLTSLSLTKLDGTAKGGIIFSIYEQLKLPIRFIGVGEQLDDLKPFSATEFMDALFSQDIAQ